MVLDAIRDDVGFYVLLSVLTVGAASAGIAGCVAKRNGTLLGVVALVGAVACICAGSLGESAMIAAAQRVDATPGLSTSDRTRIVARDEEEAPVRGEVSIGLALLPIFAGLASVLIAKRRRAN